MTESEKRAVDERVGQLLDPKSAPGFRSLWRKILTDLSIAALVIGGVSLVIGAVNYQRASDNQAATAAHIARLVIQAQGSCQFSKDLSNLPITAASSATALTIVADARGWYVKQGCVADNGPLPAPDPRVVPYITQPPR